MTKTRAQVWLMKQKQRIYCIALTVVLLFSFSACSVKQQGLKAPFDYDVEKSISSQIVASNSEYDLLWENDAKCVMLKNASSGKVWSNIPYEYYLSGGMSANVNSTLNLTVCNPQTLQTDTVNGYSEALINGNIICESIDDGLKVTYYFDKFEICVPVIYRLRDDSLEVTVLPEEIIEGETYLLVSISIAPFMCSVTNSETDSYLFVPSGSGALMYAKETADGDRKYSGEVYGVDGSRLFVEAIADNEAIRLPVFGAKHGDDALLGIIENGAESAVIEATAGNNRTGYSNIYANFYLRGYDIFRANVALLDYSTYTKVSAEHSVSPITVGYYPLSGVKANYIGMADRYRQYLYDIDVMRENMSNEVAYGVNVLGGVLTSSTVLGVPTQTLKPLTTFSQAEKITSELVETSSMKPYVMLSGFGNGGIDPGKIAGGYDFSSKLGGKRQSGVFEAYCKQKEIPLFTDFDILRYNSSGNGFSYRLGAAKSASLRVVQHSPILTPVREFDNSIKYRLLKRENLEKAIKKLLKSADRLSVSGIGLSSLGNVAYSDYSDSKYFTKGNMANDAMNLIKSVQQTSRHVATKAANAYAAAMSDVIFDVPVDNGEYNALDESIPFYQMVFGGSKPLFAPAVNFSADFDKQIMLAIIGGTGISFTLSQNFELSYLERQSEKLYATTYKNNYELIEQTLKKVEPFYQAINGARITSYEIVDNNISKTVFDNGVTLYANHGSSELDSPIGLLGAYEFRWEGVKE